MAKRKSRTLIESAKCMLLEAELDKLFREEGILTTAYLRNRIVSKSIKKTSVELFIGVSTFLASRFSCTFQRKHEVGYQGPRNFGMLPWQLYRIQNPGFRSGKDLD